MSRYLQQRALCHPALPISRKTSARNLERNIALSDDQEAFYERLGADADVRLEPGINQDEIFDEQFERRAHEIQRTPSANNAVNVIPAKQGPWSGNNQLGIERHFSPDANNRQTILKLDEWGFPEVWTLCLGMSEYSTFDNPDPISFSVTAEVEFGCGGVIQTVEMDWLQGMSISLPMNALNLVASYRTGSGEGSTSIPADLRLRANIVRGRAHRSKPTLTVFVPEGETTIEIPKFAQRVTVLPFADVSRNPFDYYSADAYVRLNSSASGGPGDGLYQLSQFTEYLDVTNERCGAPAWVPIGPFQRLLVLADNAGTPSADTFTRCAVFELAL